ncbi:coiled-coil domain-containing glutamate-rich protein 2-like isoform X2 [Narcine bancroftii]
MVYHQNLLKELEELTHHGENSAKPKLLKSDIKWNYPMAESREWNEDDNLERRPVSFKKEEINEQMNNQGRLHAKKNITSNGEEDLKGYEKSKEVSTEGQHKGKGEDDTKVIMHASKDGDKGSSEKRHGESSEEEDQRSDELGQEQHDLLKINELIEKIAKQELESREDQQGERKKHRSEEEGDVSKRYENGQESVKKRVEENASDEETNQFETEQKGLKILEAQTHLQGSADKHSLEQEQREGKGHSHFRMDLKRRREDLIDYQWKRLHGLENGKDDDEEEGEGMKRKRKEHELRNLMEIEEELKEVAEKLKDIRQG